MEPYCLAMVLCDAVHRDSSTGKHTILGTFSTLHSPSFPCPMQMAVYWAITDVPNSGSKITFRLVDSRDLMDSEAQAVFNLKFPVEPSSPLAVIEGSLVVRTELPKQGVYHCEMLAGDSILMSRRLVAVSLEGAPDDN